MKKVILTMTFLFTFGTSLLNASTATFFGDCTADAWEYGTWAGEGDETLEYLYTNQYFEMHCNEDGTYKNQITENPGN